MTEHLEAALTALTPRFGVPVSTRRIADRRGTQVWKITYADTVVALKSGTNTDDVAGLLPAREAAVLGRLAPLGVSDQPLATRVDADGSWSATRWIKGSTTWGRCAPMRARPTDHVAREDAVEVVGRFLEAVIHLHGVGWLHGDLQPWHAIHDHDHVQLIDLALARGQDEVRPWVPYRGGLAHPTAPELHQQILETDTSVHIPLSPAAEVYAAAATVLFCLTGRWPVDHAVPIGPGSDLSRLRRAIVEGRTRRVAEILPLPGHAELLRAALEFPPANRPTLIEFHQDWLAGR